LEQPTRVKVLVIVRGSVESGFADEFWKDTNRLTDILGSFELIGIGH
jgi:hypothetical protein